ARSSMPANLMELKHKNLPALGGINVCLFIQSTQHPVVSRTLADFITRRLRER
ncbi:MAG TPA: LysR family transcriptional regulator, partial [Alteromonas sp.]|nr:LysR family transcriptional regulator [Alteromonas sp.]